MTLNLLEPIFGHDPNKSLFIKTKQQQQNIVAYCQFDILKGL